MSYRSTKEVLSKIKIKVTHATLEAIFANCRRYRENFVTWLELQDFDRYPQTLEMDKWRIHTLASMLCLLLTNVISYGFEPDGTQDLMETVFALIEILRLSINEREPQQ